MFFYILHTHFIKNQLESTEYTKPYKSQIPQEKYKHDNPKNTQRNQTNFLLNP